MLYKYMKYILSFIENKVCEHWNTLIKIVLKEIHMS